MTDNKVNIRPVRREDVPFLLNFEQQLIGYERPFNATMIDEPFLYYDLPALMADDDARVLVAEENGQLIGCGYARLKQAKHYERFERYAYLGFMFVLPEHRGRGINRSIMEELSNWALGKGMSELRLEVYAENESAIKAYEKAGFEPFSLEMRSAARLTKTITIDAPIATVWEALTVPALMKQWMAAGIDIVTDWKVGSDFIITNDGFINTGKVLRYEPMRVVSYSHLSSLSQLADEAGNYTVLEFFLSGDTELRLQVSNFPTLSIYQHFNFYWNVALNELKKFTLRQL